MGCEKQIWARRPSPHPSQQQKKTGQPKNDSVRCDISVTVDPQDQARLIWSRSDQTAPFKQERTALISERDRTAVSEFGNKKWKQTEQQLLATVFIHLPTVFIVCYEILLRVHHLATKFRSKWWTSSSSIWNFPDFSNINQIKRNEVQTHLFLPPDHESKLGFHIWGVKIGVSKHPSEELKKTKMAKCK
jgi:hypothetical protein